MATTFKAALGQMSVVGGDKSRNLAKAEAVIAEAAAHGSRLIVLPEAMDLGWTHPSSQTEAEPIPGGEPYRRLAASAGANGVYLCAGLTERRGDRVFNAAALIGPNGELLSLHRKINELDIGRPYYATGDRLGVVDTELGRIGVMICSDGFAKDRILSRSLCSMGADFILSPCAWAVESGHDNAKEPYGGTWTCAYRPVAKEFSVWIAGVSNVGPMDAGPWQGRFCIGCSLVVGVGGDVLLQGPYGSEAETILYIEREIGQRSR